MSHAKYEVKWNSKRKKWELLEARPEGNCRGGYYVLDRYRLKADAKKRAVNLAKMDRAKAGFYSKDPEGSERKTSTRDFT